MLDKSLPLNALSLLLLGGQASATYLYVSSYTGVITTLELNASGNKTTLEAVASNDECGVSPSWLTLDPSDGVVYCTDEGFSGPPGTITSFATHEDGSLSVLDAQDTFVGGVSAVLYGDNANGLGVAYYGGSAFTTWDATDPASLVQVDEFVFELEEPGADPDRQEAPHPHQAALDPTGRFILVPDLGADLVRTYYVSEGDFAVTPSGDLEVPAGSGPRHLTFAVHGDTTYLYLVAELSNTIFGYTVKYSNRGIHFEQIYESGTHGEGVEVPEGASAAEIIVTSDQKYLIVSSRNENIFEIPSFDPNADGIIVSDTLINFSIDPATGGLTQLQEVPSGGRFPRQFSLNADETLVAVGQQSDGRVVLIERDPESGLLGDFVAAADVEGEVTAVIFNELI